MDRIERGKIVKALNGYRMSPFRRSVLLATLDIPEGQVRTYKEIAEIIGNPKASRAVGTALKNNPLAPTIPCHRVIRSDGGIGNYTLNSRNSAGMKARRLESEGVKVKRGRIVVRHVPNL